MSCLSVFGGAADAIRLKYVWHVVIVDFVFDGSLATNVGMMGQRCLQLGSEKGHERRAVVHCHCN